MYITQRDKIYLKGNLRDEDVERKKRYICLSEISGSIQKRFFSKKEAKFFRTVQRKAPLDQRCPRSHKKTY